MYPLQESWIYLPGENNLMGVLDDAAKFAQRLRDHEGVPFLKATYVAAQKFDRRGGETFHSILSHLRRMGARHSAAMRTSKPRQTPPAKPISVQQKFPFEQRLTYALGIQEGNA